MGNPEPIRAIPPSQNPTGIGRTRTVKHITTFKAMFQTLSKGVGGDYKLTLGVPFNQKDLAWALSDHDGKLLEVTVTVLQRVIEPVTEPPADATT